MLDGALSEFLPHIHTQAIARSQTVLEHDFLFHLRIRGRPEDGLIDHADIPLGQIFRRHGQFARGKQPALTLFRGQSRRSERIAEIAGRVGFGEAVLVDVHDALHPQWREDVLAQKLQQRLAARLLYNQSRDYEIGVAVLPLGSRIKIERLARPLVENLVRGDRLQHEGGT